MAFFGVSELALAYPVTQLYGGLQEIFVAFMILFPLLVLAGFFYVQITRPLSWYPPSELAKANPELLDFLVAGRAQKTQEASDQVKQVLEQLTSVESVEEAKEHFDILWRDGPSAAAFSFKERFPPPAV